MFWVLWVWVWCTSGRPSGLIKQGEVMVRPVFLIMDANKTKSHLAASQQSSQRCFSTYLILLTIKGRKGSARESYKAVACPVQPAHMITLSRMMSARNQTSAQWQMHTASTASVTNTIWQICPLSWLEDEEQMLLFLSRQAWERARAVLATWKSTVSEYLWTGLWNQHLTFF